MQESSSFDMQNSLLAPVDNNTRPRLETLPAEIIDSIVEMCWLYDMKDDDYRLNELSSLNHNPAKVWLLKNRIFSLSIVAKFLHSSCQRFLWRALFVKDDRNIASRLLREIERYPIRARWIHTLHLQLNEHKHLGPKYNNDDERRRMLAVFERLQPNLRRLGIDNLDGRTPWLKEHGFHDLADYFSNLELPDLTELDLRDTRFVPTRYYSESTLRDDVVARAFTKIRSLQHFRGHYISAKNADANLQGRETPISPLAHLLAAQRDLVTLKLERCSSIEANWAFIEWLPQIVTLKLRNSGREFHYDWIRNFTQKFSSSLKTLEIWDSEARWGGKRWLKMEDFNLPKLEKLSIWVSDEKPADWARMFSKCRNLRSLEIRGMESCNSLIAVVEQADWPNLQELRVSVMTEPAPMSILRKYCRRKGYTWGYSELPW